MWIFHKSRAVPFRKAATLTLAMVVIPLFVAVLLFDTYTVRQQRETLRTGRLSTLQVYLAQWEDTIQVLEEFLNVTVANDTQFAEVIYSNTKTEAYIASRFFDYQSRTLLRSRELAGAFALYSQPQDLYRPVYDTTYPQDDLMVLRQAVMDAASRKEFSLQWETLAFSDRTVLLLTYNYQQTAVAAMVDPSLLSYTGMEEDSRIFFAQPDGAAYCPQAAFGGELLPAPDPQEGQTLFHTEDGSAWEITTLELSRDMGFLCYASPTKSFLGQLSAMQQILLLITLVLLACIPLCWLTLRRLLLEPVGTLTRTMRAIQGGDTTIRVPQKSKIQEVNQISQTVNTMLDTIQQQKIDAYEQQLANQHAKLQYLHLQIRPHFFLNCLNLLYSLAGEEKYQAIQDAILDLSTYLRSIFQDSAKLVPLKAELASVESYVRIQGAGTQLPPQLKLSIDADTLKIPVPTLSLLTFVENSLKHSCRQDSPLEIRIRCGCLPGEDNSYLYVSISDNGGGFSPQDLEKLNGPLESIYTQNHVGISNIRHRLQLLYEGQATLSFRNLTDGACVELFLPTNPERTGNIPE